jgi:hypothetical protein
MRRITLVLCLTAALLSLWKAAASGIPGGVSDPLVTVSYITQKFLPSVQTEADRRAALSYEPAYAEREAQLQGAYDRAAQAADPVTAVLKELERRGVYTPPYQPQYTAQAESLRAMGLFRGTTHGDFELDRAATRLEGLVMMLRLLGEESAALSTLEPCPFPDVPNWGKPYVAYGYAKGYTKGTAAQRFDPDLPVTQEQYITFVLRALGYTDSDFAWDQSPAFSQTLGLYTAQETEMTRSPFYRDQVVYLSYAALDGQLKSGGTLREKLQLTTNS